MRRPQPPRHLPFLTTLAALLAFCILIPLANAPPALAAVSTSRYFVQAVDENLNLLPSGVSVLVFTANTATLASIFSDPFFATTLANPITADANGVAAWYGSATSYDVVVITQRGWARQAALASNTLHRLMVDQQQALKRTRIKIALTPTLTEINSGTLLPAGSLVRDVFMEHTALTATGTNTISIGTLSTESGGVATGFCNAATIGGGSAANTRCQITVAGNAYGALTRGSLLTIGTATTGQTNCFTCGGFVPYLETPYLTTAQRTISYSHNGYTGDGYIHVVYEEHVNR